MPKTTASLWTKRDVNVLESLALKSRVFDEVALLEGWFSDNEDSHEQRLAALHSSMDPLCEAGLVGHTNVYALPVPELETAYSWNPGQDDPSLEQLQQLAEYFQQRTQGLTEELFSVYYISKAGANIFGAYLSEKIENEQWSHDISLGRVVANLKQSNEESLMQQVLGEGGLPKLGKNLIFKMKDPDLFILDENKEAQLVIEMCGKSYTREHLENLHNHFRGDAYEKMANRFPNRKHRLYQRGGTSYVLV